MTGETAIKISRKQNGDDICTLWEGEKRAVGFPSWGGIGFASCSPRFPPAARCYRGRDGAFIFPSSRPRAACSPGGQGPSGGGDQRRWGTAARRCPRKRAGGSVAGATGAAPAPHRPPPPPPPSRPGLPGCEGCRRWRGAVPSGSAAPRQLRTPQAVSGWGWGEMPPPRLRPRLFYLFSFLPIFETSLPHPPTCGKDRAALANRGEGRQKQPPSPPFSPNKPLRGPAVCPGGDRGQAGRSPGQPLHPHLHPHRHPHPQRGAVAGDPAGLTPGALKSLRRM